MIAEGFAFPPDIEEEEESFNSLNIFPGTDFMKHLSSFLDYYVSRTLQTRASCENLNVIVSDSDIPGEGEHKIMAFIRSLRTSPGYNNKERHCIYGLDADLILLSLSLHDTNIIQLRELISFISYMKNENVGDRAYSKVPPPPPLHP